MVTATRARGQVMDRTLRVEEHELKLAVAQFLRSRGFHATPELVLFKWGGGGHATEGETVAEVAVKVGGPSGEADPPEPARVSR